MNKRNWMTMTLMLALLLLAATFSAFGLDIPTFDARKPLAPEDPSLVLAGIGGLGIGLAYVRSKLRR